MLGRVFTREFGEVALVFISEYTLFVLLAGEVSKVESLLKRVKLFFET